MSAWDELRKLLATDPRNVGCAERFALVDRFVEILVAGGDPESEMPGVALHLAGCPPCAADFQGPLEALRNEMAHQRSYPAMAADANRVEPAPRRIRGVVNGQTVFDTTHALYVWEWPGYPQYYVPLADVHRLFLVAPEAALVHPENGEPLAGTVRFDWGALDSWFEEDEEVFVHPRNPYTRVDALRSHRHLRVEIGGVVLAETTAPVLVFETGLPTRYYVAKSQVSFENLRASDARSSCPYKGNTSGYWSAAIDGIEHPDVAWSYDLPTRELAPIAGMVAFFNEDVDLFLDGQPVPRESAPASSRQTR